MHGIKMIDSRESTLGTHRRLLTPSSYVIKMPTNTARRQTVPIWQNIEALKDRQTLKGLEVKEFIVVVLRNKLSC